MKRARYITTLLACACFASATMPQAFAADETSRASAVAFAAPPLATSAGIGDTTWAVVPMGRRSGSFHVFWQLFTRQGDRGRWRVVTPPGVADNGGLIVGPANSRALVAFGASQDLRYSPLALSTDDGRSWEPGGLPDAIDRAPAALALGPGGHAVAIVGNESQSILTRSGDLTHWSTLAGASAIANLAPSCRIGRVSAVGLQPSGVPVLGASCDNAGVVGLFALGQRAAPLPVVVPATLASDHFAVLDIAMIGSAVVALLEATGAGRAQVFATSSRNSWRLSASLGLAAGATVNSIGWGPDGSYFVEYSQGARLLAAVGSIATTWRVFSALPRGTATVALSARASLQALAVSGKQLTVFSQAGGDWHVAQRLVVPIVDGSSS